MSTKTTPRRAAKKAEKALSTIAAEREAAFTHLAKVRTLPPSARLKLQRETDDAQMTLNTRHDRVASVVETSPGVFKRQKVVS